MAINTILPLSALTLITGMNTALSGIAGTAYMVKYISIVPNTALSAGSSVSAYALIGPTATPKQWLPLTGFTNGTAFKDPNAFIVLSGVGAGIIMSANSGGVLDVYLGGIKITT